MWKPNAAFHKWPFKILARQMPGRTLPSVCWWLLLVIISPRLAVQLSERASCTLRLPLSVLCLLKHLNPSEGSSPVLCTEICFRVFLRERHDCNEVAQLLLPCFSLVCVGRNSERWMWNGNSMVRYRSLSALSDVGR